MLTNHNTLVFKKLICGRKYYFIFICKATAACTLFSIIVSWSFISELRKDVDFRICSKTKIDFMSCCQTNFKLMQFQQKLVYFFRINDIRFIFKEKLLSFNAF